MKVNPMNIINKTDILSTMRVECQTKKEKTNTNTVEQIANVDEPKSNPWFNKVL